MQKIFLTAVIFFVTLTICAVTSAKDELSLEDAEINLVCATCSLGAYSDDESFLLRSMLTARGWKIETLSRKNNRADAKAYLVSKGNVKILTVAGTESLKDVEVDFRAGRVHLHDNSAPLDPTEQNSGNKLFVHRGFRDYADVVLGDGVLEYLKTSLGKNPNEKLYLTGHSLGGSVAVIAGLRLVDAGIPKERFKVITFGSMAACSRALAESYADKIDVTRIAMKGDVLKKSMRVLGFVHFGETLKYRQSVTDDHFEHKMAVYLDCAIRDYYEAGGTFGYDAADKVNAKIYAAPILFVKENFHKADREIIFSALNDSLANHFGNLVFADEVSVTVKEKNFFDADFDEYIAAAKSHGCDYTLIRILRAKKIRDARSGDRAVTMEEIIFDANGFPLSMQTSGATTENLTMLEAALAAQEILTADAKIFLSTRNTGQLKVTVK